MANGRTTAELSELTRPEQKKLELKNHRETEPELQSNHTGNSLPKDFSVMESVSSLVIKSVSIGFLFLTI